MGCESDWKDPARLDSNQRPVTSPPVKTRSEGALKPLCFTNLPEIAVARRAGMGYCVRAFEPSRDLSLLLSPAARAVIW